MNYRLALRIEGLPKTLNALAYKHWAVRNKEARKWKNVVGIASLGNRPKAPLIRANVKLTRYSSKRPDFDGLVASFKHVVDGLIEANIIEDDAPDSITTEYIWEKASRNEGFIEIVVEELS